MNKRLLSILFVFSFPMQASPIVFSIEGNAGAGKSMILNELCNRMPEVAPVLEPIDMVQDCEGINLFAMLFTDMSRWAFTTVTKYHLAHIERLRDTIAAHPDRIYVTDHSGFDVYYAFVQMYVKLGHISAIEKHVYDRLFAITLEQMVMPKGFIYLRTHPDVACQRVYARDRIAEQQASKEFWYHLHDAFEDMLINKKAEMAAIKDAPVLVIDANENMHEHPEYVANTIEKIEAFIHSYS